jgi:hypothetical protein
MSRATLSSVRGASIAAALTILSSLLFAAGCSSHDDRHGQMRDDPVVAESAGYSIGPDDRDDHVAERRAEERKAAREFQRDLED